MNKQNRKIQTGELKILGKTQQRAGKKNGYVEIYSEECEPEEDEKESPMDDGQPSNTTISPQKYDEWSLFKDSLKPGQYTYLRDMIHTIQMKCDYDIEEKINTIAYDTLGDCILDGGSIVEDYLEDLKRLFD